MALRLRERDYQRSNTNRFSRDIRVNRVFNEDSPSIRMSGDWKEIEVTTAAAPNTSESFAAATVARLRAA